MFEVDVVEPAPGVAVVKPTTFRIRGRSQGGTVYVTATGLWQWNPEKARTWKTRKGADQALKAKLARPLGCAVLFQAEIEEVAS